MKKLEKCVIMGVSDGKDWKLVFKGECSEVRSQIEVLPPLKQGYLIRRSVWDSR